MLARSAMAKMVQGVLLAPTGTRQQVRAFCERALDFHLAAVCVFPYWTRTAVEVLNGSDVKVCTPIGLPFGTCSTQVKLLEARAAIGAGANEIEVLINLGAFRSHDLSIVAKDLEEVINMARFAGVTENRENVLTHVVLETSYLSKEEVECACRIGVASGAEFIKTCSGLNQCHPSPREVRFLRQKAGSEMGIAVAGGIQTAAEVIELVNSGATRVGTALACEIMETVPPDPEET